MPVAHVRLVVDPNVLLSALIGGRLKWFRSVIQDHQATLCISPAGLEEFERVALRPYFRKYFSVGEAAELVALLMETANLFDLQPPYTPLCRDAKDDYLLALAKAAKADYLITGDDDLLVLGRIGRTTILTPAAFKKSWPLK